MTSIVPGYEYDIFISYRQKDNKHDGWVTEFVDNLKGELESTFKEEISVYFDINPHDGLLETHDVDASLKEKLKCLVFIPIISQTYCDSKSFAWQHEFCAFNKLAKEDQFGRDIRLASGNVANRILPVKIHDLDPEDKRLLETELGGVLRCIEFIYKSAGVNRPLRANEDHPHDNLNKTYYRDQINKVANAIKEVITGLRNFGKSILSNPLKESNIIETSFDNSRKSIAVLPFQDMSPQKDQEYFCDGMAEEIINALTHVESLKVIARTSAFAFKDKHEDIREIGKKLGVETLLEGSIRKDSNRLRITAQLIKVDDGSHLWSDRYDREMKDVFAIQDEISLAIVDNLKVMLLGKEKTAILKRHTEDLEAYMFYLKGRQSRQRKDLEGFNHALDYLEKSIALDPKFALAYAEIAFTYVLMAWFCYIIVNDELREKIVNYANKALKLDEHASDAYIALALTWELFDHDQVKAEEFARQAVSLNPGNSEAIQEYGFILGRMGNFETAIKKMESTIALDPLSVLAHNGLGYIFFYQGHFKSAIKQMQNILALDPAFFPASFIISLSLTEIEDYSHALQELNKCPQSYPSVIAHRGYLYGKMRRKEEAINALEEIKSKVSEDPLLEFLIAVIYTGMDDKDNAFDWLQRSQDKHGFVYRDRTIGADFRIANLRKDPRFRELIYY
jgi:adenylate cyclase